MLKSDMELFYQRKSGLLGQQGEDLLCRDPDYWNTEILAWWSIGSNGIGSVFIGPARIQI